MKYVGVQLILESEKLFSVMGVRDSFIVCK